MPPAPPAAHSPAHSPAPSPTHSPAPNLLIIEDDVAHLASLVKIFDRLNLRVVAAPTARGALELLERQGPFMVALTDLMLPDLDGMTLITELKARQPNIEIVMMTAFGTIERAVEAMRLGAYDFVVKPLRRAEIEKAVRRALERADLIAENLALKAQLAEVRGALQGDALIGHSAALRNALEVAAQAAASHAPVLLTGEPGVGKFTLARLIHARSERAAGPLVRISCAAIPDDQLEEELFGRRAEGGRPAEGGLARRAHGGTLVLSDLLALPLPLQGRLLRFMETGLLDTGDGADAGVRVSCRLIATCGEEPSTALEAGELRADLYYRLSVFPISVPPLRSRLDDIPLLAEAALQRAARRLGRPLKGFSPEALLLLMRHPWPGNVRELESVVERAATLCRGAAVDAADLALDGGLGELARLEEALATPQRLKDLFCVPLGTPLHEVERRLIHRALAFVGNDKRRAAQMLGITARTIYRKLAEEPSP